MTEENEDKKHIFELSFDHHSSRFFILVFSTIYAVSVAIFCLIYQVLPGLDFILLGFLIYVAYNKKAWNRLKDWLPFLIMLVSYQLLYSFIGIAVQQNLQSGPLVLDRLLFGDVASLILQQTIQTPVLDYVGAFFYTAYFFVPTLFALFLWRKSRKNYWKYTIAFGLCSYSGLITYLFYPVAPPWIAVPQVSQILVSNVDPAIGLPIYYWAFDVINPDLYGAFPSMHSGLPWLFFLFAFKVWRWKALPLVAFPVGSWFSALYLGEHYFIDIVGGVAYATVAFIAVEAVLPILFSRVSYLKKFLAKDQS